MKKQRRNIKKPRKLQSRNTTLHIENCWAREMQVKNAFITVFSALLIKVLFLKIFHGKINNDVLARHMMEGVAFDEWTGKPKGLTQSERKVMEGMGYTQEQINDLDSQIANAPTLMHAREILGKSLEQTSVQTVKDYKKADTLRKRLREEGYELEGQAETLAEFK